MLNTPSRVESYSKPKTARFGVYWRNNQRVFGAAIAPAAPATPDTTPAIMPIVPRTSSTLFIVSGFFVQSRPRNVSTMRSCSSCEHAMKSYHRPGLTFVSVTSSETRASARGSTADRRPPNLAKPHRDGRASTTRRRSLPSRERERGLRYRSTRLRTRARRRLDRARCSSPPCRPRLPTRHRTRGRATRRGERGGSLRRPHRVNGPERRYSTVTRFDAVLGRRVEGPVRAAVARLTRSRALTRTRFVRAAARVLLPLRGDGAHLSRGTAGIVST